MLVPSIERSRCLTKARSSSEADSEPLPSAAVTYCPGAEMSGSASLSIYPPAQTPVVFPFSVRTNCGLQSLVENVVIKCRGYSSLGLIHDEQDSKKENAYSERFDPAASARLVL